MDRTFEFNIREHVYSLSGMVMDFAEPTLEQSWELAELIEKRKFRNIQLIANRDFIPALTAISPFLNAAAELPVAVLPEDHSRSNLTGIHAPSSEYADTLILYLFPTLEQAEPFAIMDGYRRNAAYIVCYTDRKTYSTSKHSDLVISLKTPSLKKELPVRNYTMAALALISLGKILDSRKHGLEKHAIKTISGEIKDAAFLFTQMLNQLDSFILSYAQSIYGERDITLVGDGIDFSSACLSGLYLSKYTHRRSRICKTSEISGDFSQLRKDCVVLFTSIQNPDHTQIKNAVQIRSITAKSLFIVTDDPDMTGSDQYTVIHTPAFKGSYCAMFQAVVPSLLAGYLFP